MISGLLLSALSTFLLLVAWASDDWEFTYANHGYDFEKAIPPDGWQGVNRCGLPNNQSPISLMDPLGPHGYIYGNAIPAEAEELEVAYQDPRSNSELSFERNNFFMFVFELPEGSPQSYFKTQLPRLYYGFDLDTFTPESFHVHYTTEHYFNAKIYDVSLHTNHYTGNTEHNGNDLEMLTHSFQFDSEEYDRSISREEIQAIDNFFDDFNLNNRSTVASSKVIGVEQLRFREFMDVFDFSSRWVYLGSAAFPPCNQINFWQVLRRVYPIKPEHAEMVKKTFEVRADELGATTNNRGIYPVNGHRVRFVSGYAAQMSLGVSLLIGLLVD